MGIEGAK